ncbi:hypothetical protein CSQ89_13615 [Chitinimonas sp. BJB300]|nr:hypothetical protein CSQ89_13615 [Chitinimonas sp. BJB300]
MKRIVLAVRGGVPSGLSAVLVIVVLILVLALGIGGFLGGFALATKRNQTQERNLITQTRAAKLAEAKMAGEKAELEKFIEALKVQTAARKKDMDNLKDQLDRARLERETMDKVLTEIRDSFSGAGAKGDKAEKVKEVVNGAMLKFGGKECGLSGSVVKNKEDVQCLNLRESIDAMNSKPAGNADKAAKPADAAKPEDKAKTVVPAQKEAPAAKPAGH